MLQENEADVLSRLKTFDFERRSDSLRSGLFMGVDAVLSFEDVTALYPRPGAGLEQCLGCSARSFNRVKNDSLDVLLSTGNLGG